MDVPVLEWSDLVCSPTASGRKNENTFRLERVSGNKETKETEQNEMVSEHQDIWVILRKVFHKRMMKRAGENVVLIRDLK